jgi:hypothetical protein
MVCEAAFYPEDSEHCPGCGQRYWFDSQSMELDIILTNEQKELLKNHNLTQFRPIRITIPIEEGFNGDYLYNC